MQRVYEHSQEEPFLPPKVVRERLSVGQSGFAAALRQGLPHYKINKRVLRFRMSEVEAWLAERRRGEDVQLSKKRPAAG